MTLADQTEDPSTEGPLSFYARRTLSISRTWLGWVGWDICQVGRTSWSCCLCRVHWACPSLKTFAQRSSKPCLETRQSRHDRISNGYSESAIIYPPTPHSPIEYNHHSMSSHSILRILPSPCLFCLFGHDIRGHCTPRCPSQQTPESQGTLRKKWQ